MKMIYLLAFIAITMLLVAPFKSHAPVVQGTFCKQPFGVFCKNIFPFGNDDD